MLPKHARYQLCYIPIKKSHLYHIVALPDWAIIRAMLINGIWTRDLQSPIDNICWRDFVVNNNKTMHTLKDLNSKLWFWRPSCYQLHQRCLKWNSFMLPLTVYRKAEGKGFEPLVRSSRTSLFKSDTINQLWQPSESFLLFRYILRAFHIYKGSAPII